MNGTFKECSCVFWIFAHMSSYRRDSPHSICEVVPTSLSLIFIPLPSFAFLSNTRHVCLSVSPHPLEHKLHESRDFVLFIIVDIVCLLKE